MAVSGIDGPGRIFDATGAVRAAADRLAEARVAGEDDAPGFGEMLNRGVSAVSRSENSADDLAQRFAVGDPDVEVHDVTVAASEASLNVQLLVAVRDRAVEAYQQIVNLQV